MIDLPPAWRLLLVLAALAVIPVAILIGWADEAARSRLARSYRYAQLRSWWRGRREASRAERRRPTG